MRNTNTSHHPRGANGTGTDTNLDRINTARHQCGSTRARGDIAGNQLHIGERVAHPSGRLQHTVAVPVGGIDHENVNTRLNERAGAIEIVTACPNRGGHPQAPVPVLVGIGELPTLVNILDGNETLEQKVFIDDGQFLDAMSTQDLLGLIERCANRRGNEIVGRHHVAQRTVEIALKLQITVGKNTHQHAIPVDNRHTGDLEAHHKCNRFAQRGGR